MAVKTRFDELVEKFSKSSDSDLNAETIAEWGLHLSETDEEWQNYLVAYNELCFSVTKTTPTPVVPSEAMFLRAFVESLPHIYNVAYHKICVELNYCELRKKSKDFTDIAGPIADVIANIYEAKTLGIPTACWVISTKALDRLCECKD